MNKYLIAGLGNPGILYKNTRHNLGFRIVETLAKKYDLKFKDEKKFKAKVAYGKILDFDVYLLLPLTYMNESGIAIKKAVDYLKIDIKNILVVVDDADILFEEFRLKKDSSSGGHRGLQSIETHLKSQKFARLRVGIGREKKALKTYVLDQFTAPEKKRLPTIVKKACEYIELYLKEGLEKAATKANVRLKKIKRKNKMTQNRVRLYEGMYIINSNLSEDAKKKALEKITKAIEEKKGEIYKIHDMGKRKLAYEIDKKREGYYYLIYFSIDSSTVKDLWTEYLLHEDIIRFMTVKADNVLETLEFKSLVIQS